MSRFFCVSTTLLLLAIGSTSCNSSKHSKIKRLPGKWQATPIAIDGKNNDWPSPYPEYDDKAMLGYAVSNDKDNLYITVETGDPATQLKLLRNGLTVWIDRKGEKEEVTAINYPIPVNGEQKDSDRPGRMKAQQGQGGSQQSQDKERMDLEDKVRRTLPQAKEYSLQGFKSCNLQFPLLEKDTCGIIVRMDLDTDNELIWEAVIPLKTFYFKPEMTRADKGRALSICFETEGLPRPAGQNDGNRGNGGGSGMRPSVGFGGMGGMGMGMRMGGGGNHGSRSGNTQNNNITEPMYKSTKTWKTFGLAYQE